MFQSTHPQGVRRMSHVAIHDFILVSIHAPAGGATRKRCQHGNDSKFQSTHPQGVRQFDAESLAELQQFQSTHPQGVRLRQDHRLPIGKGFNPRTRRGCDQPRAGNCLPYVVSIHAPAGGATMCRVSSRVTRSFNPRTRRGCDEADGCLH